MNNLNELLPLKLLDPMSIESELNLELRAYCNKGTIDGGVTYCETGTVQY